jgi:CDP-diacylglycerol--glycerol-3-phosphate 3-phosphatidyltransferase
VSLPSAIVAARAVATVPISLLLAFRTPAGDAAALAIFAVAAMSDLLDGYLARRRHQTTALGAYLDPLADKVLVIGVLGALALRGVVPPWAIAFVIGREALAVALRTAAPVTLPASLDGKANTAAQMAATGALIAAAATRSAEIGVLADGGLAVALALTVVSGVRLMLRATQARAHAG